jgi:hypothetical protein
MNVPFTFCNKQPFTPVAGHTYGEDNYQVLWERCACAAVSWRLRQLSPGRERVAGKRLVGDGLSAIFLTTLLHLVANSAAALSILPAIFFLGLDNSPPTQGGAWALVFGYILLIDSYLNPPVLKFICIARIQVKQHDRLRSSAPPAYRVWNPTFV